MNKSGNITSMYCPGYQIKKLLKENNIYDHYANSRIMIPRLQIVHIDT